MAYAALAAAGPDKGFSSKIIEIWNDLVSITFGEATGKNSQKTLENLWQEEYALLRNMTPSIVLKEGKAQLKDMIL